MRKAVGMPDPDVDVAVVGAGGAGSLLLLALDARCRATGADPPRVAVIDPVRNAAATTAPGASGTPGTPERWSRR